QEQGLWYTVQPGDTMRSISERCAVPPHRIVTVNDLPRGLQPGLRLWLPGATRMAPATSAAVPTGYRIVSRADWGAQALRPHHDPMNGISRITLHHTSEIPGMSARTDDELVQAIQRYHQDAQGWAASHSSAIFTTRCPHLPSWQPPRPSCATSKSATMCPPVSSSATANWASPSAPAISCSLGWPTSANARATPAESSAYAWR
ncbi:MAG: LysM peptidoglycan-binding domain-containing protein, partial [Planctomycetota bacterium]